MEGRCVRGRGGDGERRLRLRGGDGERLQGRAGGDGGRLRGRAGDGERLRCGRSSSTSLTSLLWVVAGGDLSGDEGVYGRRSLWKRRVYKIRRLK